MRIHDSRIIVGAATSISKEKKIFGGARIVVSSANVLIIHALLYGTLYRTTQDVHLL